MMELRPIEDVFRDVGSVEDVLSRHGYDASRRNLLCPNPDHGDNSPGTVKILPSSDHPGDRIYCHSCGLNENSIGLARLLGERIEFMREAEERPGRPRTRLRKLSWRPPTSLRRAQRKTLLTQELENDPTIEWDWIAAKTLARLGSREAVRKEIHRNFDYLSENYNLGRVWQLLNRMWEWGVRVHGLPNDTNDPKSWKAWVDKVAKDLER